MCFCGTFVYLFRARRGRRLDRIRFVLLGVLRARDCGVRMSPAREPVALILCWNIQDFVFCWMQSCLGCNRALDAIVQSFIRKTAVGVTLCAAQRSTLAWRKIGEVEPDMSQRNPKRIRRRLHNY